jgi:hypothetical protein
VWPFIAQGHGKYNVTQGPTSGPGWLDPYVLGHYLHGVVNDVFNGMEAVVSCHLATSRVCAVQRWVVGKPRIVAVHHEWAAGQRYIVVACYEWPADWRCPVMIL